MIDLINLNFQFLLSASMLLIEQVLDKHPRFPLTCRANDMQRVSSINIYLKNMCRTENIFYINNDTIPSEYLHSDGIHLIYKGTVILANNILSSINGTYNNIY